jgi:hypothetical protein
MRILLHCGQGMTLLTCWVKEGNPFSGWEFVRKYQQHIVQEMCAEKRTVFNNYGLFRATTRRVDDIISDLLNQLDTKTKEFENFCLALAEVKYTSNAAQLLIFIRGITKSFQVAEVLKFARLNNRRIFGPVIETSFF